MWKGRSVSSFRASGFVGLLKMRRNRSWWSAARSAFFTSKVLVSEMRIISKLAFCLVINCSRSFMFGDRGMVS